MLYFLKNKIGVKGKIGVYGRSLGCIAAIQLADKVDMIIADRGFCDLWTLADLKFHGKFASKLFKFGSGGWQANNSYNFLAGSMSKYGKVDANEKSQS